MTAGFPLTASPASWVLPLALTWCPQSCFSLCFLWLNLFSRKFYIHLVAIVTEYFMPAFLSLTEKAFRAPPQEGKLYPLGKGFISLFVFELHCPLCLTLMTST